MKIILFELSFHFTKLFRFFLIQNALKVGSGKLHVNFTGLLNDKLKRFYRRKYVHPSGEERYAATTQFEVILYLTLSY